MRVFIGIEFNDKEKEYLHKIKEIIRPNTISGEYTSYSNFHLTIKYIGKISDDDLEVLMEVIDDVSYKIKPFYLKFGELGSFDRKHSSIVWMGFQNGKSSLTTLFKHIESKTVSEGFEEEGRKYRPHVTMGKKVVFNGNTVTELLPSHPDSIEVKYITLFESHRVNGVLTYTPIYRKELEGE